MTEAYGFTQLQWNPEYDPKLCRFWLCDLAHMPAPWKPLSITHWLTALRVGMGLAAAKLSLPRSEGWDVRIKDGLYYLAMIEAKPEEIPEREKVYRERMQPIIEGFDKAWDKAMAEWFPIVECFKELCHPEQLKKLTDVELFELLEDYELRCHRRCWVDYFLWLYMSLDVYNLFGDLCQKLTGIDIEHPTFKKLLGGFDTVQFQIDKENWRLGNRTRELGIDQLFLTSEDEEELMSKLQTSNEGREWLDEYHEFLNVYGWRCSGWMDIATPSWIEKPSEGLRNLKGAVAKEGPYAPDAHKESLVKQREEAEKEILAKVPSGRKDTFTKLMKVAERSSWFQEEHAVFTGMLDTAIARHIFMEYGRRFAEVDMIDKQEDVFFLLMPEIMRGAVPPYRINLRPYVNKHREEWESNLKIKPQPFIGDIAVFGEQSWMDPLARIMSGVPRVRPELKADLYGVSSCKGIIEGVARVIMSQTELGQLKPGEILVTVITNAMWTSVFGIISGLVTDVGGSLSHALIVAREYGIPAVVGTHEATEKIKTGDRVRVDGESCCVYILDKVKPSDQRSELQ